MTTTKAKRKPKILAAKRAPQAEGVDTGFRGAPEEPLMPTAPTIPKLRRQVMPGPWFVAGNSIKGKGDYLVEVALAKDNYVACFEVELSNRNATTYDILQRALMKLAERCVQTGEPLTLVNSDAVSHGARDSIPVHPTQDRFGSMCVGIRIIAMRPATKIAKLPVT